jgi:hypothetical protein
MSRLTVRKPSTKFLAMAVVIALVGLTGAVSAVLEHQLRTEWVTIRASDPPPPIPYSAVDNSLHSDPEKDGQ